MSLHALTQSERDTLEQLIDRTNAATVLDAIAEICAGKALHIQENWQDEKTARPWERASTAVTRLVRTIAV
jgi:hypothetical protein